jgi:hypothetical protein
VDPTVESYEEWRDRTQPERRLNVSKSEWFVAALGLFFIFALDEVSLGCLLFLAAAPGPTRALLAVGSERTRRRLSILWAFVYVAGSGAVLITQSAGFWAWSTWSVVAAFFVVRACLRLSDHDRKEAPR